MIDTTRPQIIDLPRIYDPRGNLTFVQDMDQIPFAIRRAFWVYDVPAGEERGGHAYHEAAEVIVAVGGAFNVNLFDGTDWVTYQLNRPYRALYVPPLYWRTLDNFASGSVCMALMPTEYDEQDYIRDFEEYKRIRRKK